MTTTDTSQSQNDPAESQAQLANFGLYAGTVFVWGTSWYALKLQVGVVAPHVSLTWRFILAAIIMWAIIGLTKRPMRFSLRDHLDFAGLGLFLFSTNFALFYYAGSMITSGLLSVIFSLASIINIALALIVYRLVPTKQVLLGAALGVTGIGALFWPEISNSENQADMLLGLGLCVAGTLSFCIGNLFSMRIQRRGLSVMASNAWGMSYGAAINAFIALMIGAEFIIEPTASYILSLVWLATTATVMAFWFYLTLLGRIGSAKAAYTTVLFPIIAMLVSTMMEDYQWSVLAVGGVGLALLGNVLVLTSKSKPASKPKT
ncbi:MAG: EamA family transporter [Hyphomicrobiales bacterium]|nr:MAG: EamA family transporter [Hyphomicrobiales bacterium]